MSFDLTVVLTGLVGFVENTCRNSKAQMCALLVDGDPGRSSTFDNSALRRHRAFVRFPVDNVSSFSQSDGLPLEQQESSGLWYLQRDRLFIQVQADGNASPGDNEFRVKRLAVPAQGHPRKPADVPLEDRSSFSWVLDMEKVFPGFRVEPALLSQSPPNRSVAAQVVIDGGTLATKSTTKAVWRFDPTLSGAPYEQVFAHEVMLSYKNLAAARLLAVSFDPPHRSKFLDLTGLQRGGQLEIHIVNTCDDNPLQWTRADNPTPDEDTKWIFELVAGNLKNTIQTALADRALPIPHPIEILADGIGSPGSGNCIPPRLGKAQFSFEEIDGPAFTCQEA